MSSFPHDIHTILYLPKGECWFYGHTEDKKHRLFKFYTEDLELAEYLEYMAPGRVRPAASYQKGGWIFGWDFTVHEWSSEDVLKEFRA